MKRSKLIIVTGITCLLLASLVLSVMAGCATPTPTSQPTVAPTATTAPSATVAPTPSATVASPTAKTIKLRYSIAHGINSFPDRGAVRWASEVEKRTNGQVKFELYRGASVLGPANTIDGVVSGVVDVGTCIIAISPGRFPLLQGIDLCNNFPSSKVANMVFWDLLKKFDPAETKNVKVAYVFTAAPANIYGKVPIRKMEDLKGVEIRTTGSGAPVLSALGGTPVVMPQEEVYEALSKGIVKGNMSSFDVLQSMRQAELCKYATWTYLQTASFYTIFNLSSWNALPDNVKKVIDDLSVEQCQWVGDDMDKENLTALQWAQDNYGLEVINLSADELARWNATIKPLNDKWITATTAKGLPAQEFIDTLNQLRDQYAQEFK